MKNSHPRSEDRSKFKTARKRYSLDELLKGCTPKNIRILMRETACALDGLSVGKEVT